jgi:hypothetical protein
MSTVDLALSLLTGDEPQPTQTPSARTIEKAVAWEIEDEIAAKTGRARFGPLQALAGDLDALEESIKEVDAWLAKNVDDLDGRRCATCRTTRSRTRSSLRIWKRWIGSWPRS